MNKLPTVFEQVVIAAERMRELREKRYGSMATGVFDPLTNKKMPRIVDQALEEIESGEIGREHLYLAMKRRTEKPKHRR